MFVAVMAALVTILGVILPRLREGDQPPANGKQNREAEVERAYLAYWDALEEAYLRLDPSALADLTTPDARERDRKAIEEQRQQGMPRRVFASHHDYRIKVYRGGELASLDAVYILHRASLDLQTLEPVEPEATLPFHDSFVMRRIGGKWKVDDEVIFGTGSSMPNIGISQAAASIENPISKDLQMEIENAYLTYLAARVEAYRKLDPAPLEKLLTGQALESALSFVNELRQKSEQFIVDLQHNYRVAAEGSELAYVYDTVADRSVTLDRATGKPVEPARTDIFRYSYT
ncbi:MAG: nuclear transport factor 2 family protein, partial [Actinomycetota bacterium]